MAEDRILGISKGLLDRSVELHQCVGCGYCCLSRMCHTGIDHHGKREKRCPFLIWVEDKYRCQLVIDGKAHVWSGHGCTSSLNSWRRNIKNRG